MSNSKNLRCGPFVMLANMPNQFVLVPPAKAAAASGRLMITMCKIATAKLLAASCFTHKHRKTRRGSGDNGTRNPTISSKSLLFTEPRAGMADFKKQWFIDLSRQRPD
jgi:hypothetical protein